MAEKKYQGHCHCERVAYEVALELETVIDCNCSICSKKASLLAFCPEAKFKLVRGGDQLQDYQFNKQVIHHLFCKHCGVSSFSRGKGPDGKDMVAINVRCLDGVDVSQLKVHHYDGASL